MPTISPNLPPCEAGEEHGGSEGSRNSPQVTYPGCAELRLEATQDDKAGVLPQLDRKSVV